MQIRAPSKREETLLWVTFSSSSYAELMLNWVAHVEDLQVRAYLNAIKLHHVHHIFKEDCAGQSLSHAQGIQAANDPRDFQLFQQSNLKVWLQVPYTVVALDSAVDDLCQKRSIPHLNYALETAGK